LIFSHVERVHEIPYGFNLYGWSDLRAERLDVSTIFVV